MNKYIILIGLVILFLTSSTSHAQYNNRVVVLEADVVKFLDDAAKTKDAALQNILGELRNETDTSVTSLIKSFGNKFKKKNLVLANYYPVRGQDNSSVEEYLIVEIDNCISENVRIIKDRLVNFGVASAVVWKSGSRRITVELPGDENEDIENRLMVNTGYLSFHFAKDKDFVSGLLKDIDNALEKSNPESGKNQFTKLINFDIAAGLNQLPVNTNAVTQAESLLNREDVKTMTADLKFAWSAKLIRTTQDYFIILYFLKKETELTGAIISDAAYSVDPGSGNPYTHITMNKEGAEKFEKITGDNIGKELAIVFDGIVFSVPVIMEKITGGSINITGLANIEAAKTLPVLIKSGALPMQLKIVSQSTK